jgi:hypothetical protein
MQSFIIHPEIVTVNLAMRICEKLGPPKHCQRDFGNEYIVVGKVPLSHGAIKTKAKAKCRFHISPDWTKKMPLVVCEEAWRAPGNNSEWHISDRGGLCTELELRWRDEVHSVYRSKGLCPAADFAADWLLNSTATLLGRHLMLFRNIVSRWDDSWEYWAHEKLPGEAEYTKLKRTAAKKA